MCKHASHKKTKKRIIQRSSLFIKKMQGLVEAVADEMPSIQNLRKHSLSEYMSSIN